MDYKQTILKFVNHLNTTSGAYMGNGAPFVALVDDDNTLAVVIGMHPFWNSENSEHLNDTPQELTEELKAAFEEHAHVITKMRMSLFGHKP